MLAQRPAFLFLVTRKDGIGKSVQGIGDGEIFGELKRSGHDRARNQRSRPVGVGDEGQHRHRAPDEIDPRCSDVVVDELLACFVGGLLRFDILGPATCVERHTERFILDPIRIDHGAGRYLAAAVDRLDELANGTDATFQLSLSSLQITLDLAQYRLKYCAAEFLGRHVGAERAVFLGLAVEFIPCDQRSDSAHKITQADAAHVHQDKVGNDVVHVNDGRPCRL